MLSIDKKVMKLFHHIEVVSFQLSARIFSSFHILNIKARSWYSKLVSSVLERLIAFYISLLFKYELHDEIYKNASLANSNVGIYNKSSISRKLLSIGCSTHLLWVVEHVCIYGFMMINVYLYLCMFCCCCMEKYNLYFTVVKLKRTLVHRCIQKGLNGWTYIVLHSSQHIPHARWTNLFWGQRLQLLRFMWKIEIAFLLFC